MKRLWHEFWVPNIHVEQLRMKLYHTRSCGRGDAGFGGKRMLYEALNFRLRSCLLFKLIFVNKRMHKQCMAMILY